VEFVASPRRRGDVITGITAVARDVTQRRSLEAQVQQAQKMESLGTLAGGIAHDFNNILAAISGYTELTKMTVTAAPAREYLNAVSTAATRATELVRQILAFSRQNQPQRTPLQLRQVIQESLKLLRATIPSTVEFRSELAPDAAPVLADATQIHQVIINLATNAWHAMGDRPGRLTIELINLEVDDFVASTNPNLKAGHYVRVSVSDTGCGMDRNTLTRIFEPFFTTKPPGIGTGLGLSVVHGIMRNHDGAVTVYSEPGAGTTFHLYFPQYAGRTAATAAAPASLPRGHGERVLFVDDEAVLAALSEVMLRELGYTATTMTQPGEALELVRQNPAAWDLVITDFTMPGMTGVDLAQAIHAVRADLPIVLMTGYTIGLTVERLRPVGIRHILPKPQTAETFAFAIQQALRPDPQP
jgi:signal transduction histidine kinase/ActR/RegA family two-component response regulator